MTINRIIAFIGYFIIIINAILFLKSFSYHGKAFRVFSFYLLFETIILVTSSVCSIFHIPNLFFSHFYFILQFIFLSLFYKNLAINSIQKDIVKFILYLVTTILIFQYFLQPNLLKKFNLLEILFTSIPLIMYSIIHFYNILSSNRSFFYINTGVLFYLSGSTLLFVAGNYIVSSSSILNKSIWIVNSGLFVIFQILIFIEWRKNYYKKTRRS